MWPAVVCFPNCVLYSCRLAFRLTSSAKSSAQSASRFAAAGAIKNSLAKWWPLRHRREQPWSFSSCLWSTKSSRCRSERPFSTVLSVSSTRTISVRDRSSRHFYPHRQKVNNNPPRKRKWYPAGMETLNLFSLFLFLVSYSDAANFSWPIIVRWTVLDRLPFSLALFRGTLSRSCQQHQQQGTVAKGALGYRQRCRTRFPSTTSF